MKVCVIGSGPAGVMAAHAALQNGHRVTMLHPVGSDFWSRIHGAQYVHCAIGGIPEDIAPFKIRYMHIGSETEYRKKIYGDSVPPGGTSWGRYGPVELAWSMPEVYEYLGRRVLDNASVIQETVTKENIHILVEEFAYVINTAPLPYMDPDATYLSEEIYTVPEIPRGMQVPDNTIGYIGTSQAPYRVSKINGIVSSEYPARAFDKFGFFMRRNATKLTKPLSVEGLDLPGVFLLGRYGKWRKGQLAHHAYEEALRIFQEGRSWQATQV